jgi:hypothetical protein
VEFAKFTAAEKSASSSKHSQFRIDNFFDIKGIVHKEFIPPFQTMNGSFYCEILKQLREGIWHKHPDKWKKNSWFLHHVNAPAHTSVVVRQFLTSKNITVIFHRPVRLTLPPVTFSYFPR